MYPDNQGDLPGSSSDRDVHHKHTRVIEIQKYLGESCCHRIECITTTLLAAFMWRRPLNSTVLATTTHRKPKRMSDRTNTQVRAQMINKYRVKMIQGELYSKRPFMRREEGERKNTIAIKNV